MLNTKPLGIINYQGKIFLYKSRDIKALIKASKRRGGEVASLILREDAGIELQIQFVDISKSERVANVFFRLAYDGIPFIPVVTIESLKGDEEAQLFKIFKNILPLMNENWLGWDALFNELEKTIIAFHPIIK